MLLLALSLLIGSDLVGPESCRACHAEAYAAWQSSAHARAKSSLTAEQQKQPLCLQCHSRDEAREGQADVSGVTCETCHGGGRYYQQAAVMRDKELSHLFGLSDPTAATCKVCHGGESPAMRPFNAEEAMKKIDHWTAARAARKAKTAQRPAPKTKLAAWLAQGGP